MSIIEEIAANAIRSGANAVEVEYKDELYGIAKKSKRITVDGREYELRCRLYDSFGEHAFRLRWKPVKGIARSQRQKTS